MTLVAELIIVGKIVGGALLGGVVGAEREFSHKPAGLRTHMMLAATATLLVSIVSQMMQNPVTPETHLMVRADPVRIIEAIVAGVAFLGAGTIIRGKSGSGIEGLTTAASLLLVAVIGISVALNLFVVAVATTVLSLIMLRVLRRLEVKMAAKGDRSSK